MSARKQQYHKQKRQAKASRNTTQATSTSKAPQGAEQDDPYEQFKAASDAMTPVLERVAKLVDHTLDQPSTTKEERRLATGTYELINHISRVETLAMEVVIVDHDVCLEAIDDFEALTKKYQKLARKWQANELSCANLKRDLEQARATQAEHKKLHLQVVADRDELRRRMAQLDNEKQEAVKQSAQQRRANTQLQSQQAEQQKEIDRLERCETRPCPICLEERQPCTFVCGHTGCRDCLSLLSQCHLCRSPDVKLIIDLHL